MTRPVMTLIALMLPIAALGNDTAAVLSAGGLVPIGTPEVEMAREVLTISPEKVSVDYVFHNRSAKDVATIVAFPLPDITGGDEQPMGIPDTDSANFLDFTATQDGKPVQTSLDQRAGVGGRDVTAELTARKVPLMPMGHATLAALSHQPAAVLDEWERRGIVRRDEVDYGNGPQIEVTPLWSLKQSLYWTARFPAGQEVKVAHRYRPSVGGTVAVTFAGRDAVPGQRATYRQRYCMDETFERAVDRKLAKGPMTESWLSYILGTGANWAGGKIGDFTLIVDKGRPDALVSFCGANVQKIGPTRFQMHARDFAPPQMLDILILNPAR